MDDSESGQVDFAALYTRSLRCQNRMIQALLDCKVSISETPPAIAWGERVVNNGTRVGIYGTSAAIQTLAIIDVVRWHEYIRDGCTWLVSTYRDTDSRDHQLNHFSRLPKIAYVLEGLTFAPEAFGAETVAAMLNILRGAQNADGWWPIWDGAEPDGHNQFITTCYTLRALVNHNTPQTRSMIAAALAWTCSHLKYALANDIESNDIFIGTITLGASVLIEYEHWEQNLIDECMQRITSWNRPFNDWVRTYLAPGGDGGRYLTVPSYELALNCIAECQPTLLFKSATFMSMIDFLLSIVETYGAMRNPGPDSDRYSTFVLPETAKFLKNLAAIAAEQQRHQTIRAEFIEQIARLKAAILELRNDARSEVNKASQDITNQIREIAEPVISNQMSDLVHSVVSDEISRLVKRMLWFVVAGGGAGVLVGILIAIVDQGGASAQNVEVSIATTLLGLVGGIIVDRLPPLGRGKKK